MESQKENPRVSLCMIVKNEEKNMERVLSWGEGILWEKIVVDTGSTDKTVELAEKLGAKVYHFPWIDDFAAARNFALEKVEGDWILMLDADEYPAPGMPEKLFPVLAQMGGFDGAFCSVFGLDEKGGINACSSRILLFRNTPMLRYRRRIHEQLGFTDGREMRLANGEKELAFFHDGYAGEVYEKKKSSKRNLHLLEQELSEHPKDYEIMGYLGDEYRNFGDIKQAKKWYLRSVGHMPKTLPGSDPRSSWTFSSLILLYAMEGSHLEAEQIYETAVKKQPGEADFDYQMGIFCVAASRWANGAVYLSRALAKVEQSQTGNSCMQTKASLEQIYENLALCFLRSGRRKEAVETAVALLKAKPYDMKGLYILLSAFYEDGGEKADTEVYMENVLSFLKRIYVSFSLKDRFFIAKAAEKAGWDVLKLWVEGGKKE